MHRSTTFSASAFLINYGDCWHRDLIHLLDGSIMKPESVFFK